jgi:hypothetical protein
MLPLFSELIFLHGESVGNFSRFLDLNFAEDIFLSIATEADIAAAWILNNGMWAEYRAALL